MTVYLIMAGLFMACYPVLYFRRVMAGKRANVVASAIMLYTMIGGIGVLLVAMFGWWS